MLGQLPLCRHAWPGILLCMLASGPASLSGPCRLPGTCPSCPCWSRWGGPWAHSHVLLMSRPASVLMGGPQTALRPHFSWVEPCVCIIGAHWRQVVQDGKERRGHVASFCCATLTPCGLPPLLECCVHPVLQLARWRPRHVVICPGYVGRQGTAGSGCGVSAEPVGSWP